MSVLRLLKTTDQWAKGIEIEHPGKFSLRLARLVEMVVWPVVRFLFRPILSGVEHLPEKGPVLLVANHSAGMGLAEIMSFMALYFRQVGPDRPLAGFALPQGFHVFPLNRFLHALGAVPSTYDAAKTTLAAGVPIVIFPGGDHETLRPIWKANCVDFGGRVGFLKIAQEAGAPIVPMGIHGAHYTCPIFYRAKWLAWVLVIPRMLGIKRWGISLLSVLGAFGILAVACIPLGWRVLFVWLWLGSILVFTPCVPWTIRIRIGRPIPPAELFGDTDHPAFAHALASVERAVEALVNGKDQPVDTGANRSEEQES